MNSISAVQASLPGRAYSFKGLDNPGTQSYKGIAQGDNTSGLNHVCSQQCAEALKNQTLDYDTYDALDQEILYPEKGKIEENLKNLEQKLIRRVQWEELPTSELRALAKNPTDSYNRLDNALDDVYAAQKALALAKGAAQELHGRGESVHAPRISDFDSSD